MITLSAAAVVQVIVGQTTSTYDTSSVTNISFNIITNALTLDFQIGSTTNGTFIPAPRQPRTRVSINLTTGAYSTDGGLSGTLDAGTLYSLQTDAINLQNDSESYASTQVVPGNAVTTALPTLTATPPSLGSNASQSVGK